MKMSSFNFRAETAIVCILIASLSSAQTPIVIAHRGASGYVPEHTLEAYAMAHALGADYIEPDLVLSQDNVFVCLHDIHLEATTDVEEKFPVRKRSDGRWYAADFTLAELKTLAVHERLPGRFPKGKSAFEIPTLTEMIELVQGLNGTTKREAGIYPELKEPSWHRENGLPMEKHLLDVLSQYGYTGSTAKVFVQCFEPEPLKMIRGELKSELPLIQLIGDDKRQAAMITKEGIAAIAEYANGIGPDKDMIEANPDLVTWAHENKLAVHPYTFRSDLPVKKYASFDDEVKQFFFVYRVDGLFTDQADKAVAARAAGR